MLILRLYDSSTHSLPIGDVTISGLSCLQCTAPTFPECSGNNSDDPVWCKFQTMRCNSDPVSSLTVSVPVLNPSGTLTFEASIQYRSDELDTACWPYQYCLDVRAYDTKGLGVMDSAVRNKIEQGLAGGLLCDYAFDWNFARHDCP